MIGFCRKTKLSAIALSLMLLGPRIATAQIAWVKNFDDALQRAAKEKKYVLLDISASW